VTISFDTNILFYATAPEAGVKAARARDVISRGMEAQNAVLLFQAIAEFGNAALRKRAVRPSEIRGAIRLWRAVLEVHAAEESDLYDALEAVANHRLSFWDAVFWATARRIGVTHLLSEDFQDGRVLGGVRFVNPFVAANTAIIDRLFA
jgi:predicted nucleic acid-binding protein